jgi:hypothetical protein
MADADTSGTAGLVLWSSGGTLNITRTKSALPRARLVEHLNASGFVVMRKPLAGAPSPARQGLWLM